MDYHEFSIYYGILFYNFPIKETIKEKTFKLNIFLYILITT